MDSPWVTAYGFMDNAVSLRFCTANGSSNGGLEMHGSATGIKICLKLCADAREMRGDGVNVSHQTMHNFAMV